MAESLSSPAPNDPITELRTDVEVLVTALVLWAVDDRTRPDVEQAGVTAVETARHMITNLDVIATAVDREIRDRRDAVYRTGIMSRYDSLIERLKKGQGPHTPDTDAPLPR